MTRPAPELGVEPLVDLSRLVAGVRWRRRTWTVLAVIGLVVGVITGSFLPTRSTAAVQVYVVHADESSGTIDTLMKTDLALLQTTTVAAEAVERLGESITPEKFVALYSGDIVAGHILEITTRGQDDTQAVARAQAVADAFIAVHLGETTTARDSQVAAINGLRQQAQQQLDAVNGEITAAGRDAAGLATLDDQRQSIASQISSLDQQAQQAGIGAPAVAAGTKIIYTPHMTSHSLLVAAGLYGGMGLLLGLGLGLVAAAVMTVARDRPTLRRDIAAHLGASVIAQLPAPPRGPRRLRQGRRNETERRRASAALARLIGQEGAPIALLELGCASTAAALAVDLAQELATNHPVVIVDDLPGEELRTVTAGVTEGFRLVDGIGFPEISGQPAEAREQRLAVASVGPGAAWTDLGRLGREALLVVRAGSAETSWLHTVARQLADTGIAVVGVVLVHPDPRDRTDGTLWDALHTAVRGRLAAGAPAAVQSSQTPCPENTEASTPPRDGSARPVAPTPACPPEPTANGRAGTPSPAPRPHPATRPAGSVVGHTPDQLAPAVLGTTVHRVEAT